MAAFRQTGVRRRRQFYVRGINDELSRHASEIQCLRSELAGKAGADSLWKVSGVVLTVAGLLSGIILTIIEHFRR